MTLKALDGLSAVDPRAARALGFEAIGRYLPVPGAGYPITRNEAAAYTSAEFGIWSIFELSATEAEAGAAKGRLDAVAAVAAAEAIGQPKGTAIYGTNDSTVSNFPAVEAYFAAFAAGVKAAGYKPGFYGQLSVYALIRGYGYDYCWHAPDGDTSNPAFVTMYQPPLAIVTIGVNGNRYDTDEIYAADFGGWTLAGPWPSPVPKPPRQGVCDVNMPVYQAGEKGPQIGSFQAALREQGWGADVPNFRITGVYDPPTVETVHRFCVGKHIGGDAGTRWGGECWAALFPVKP